MQLFSRNCSLLFGRVLLCTRGTTTANNNTGIDTDWMILEHFHSFNWMNCFSGSRDRSFSDAAKVLFEQSGLRATRAVIELLLTSLFWVRVEKKSKLGGPGNSSTVYSQA
jgi:hypothetical protein